MQANTYPLSQILLPDRRYLIPTFQRDYEWTREGQWELLFEDLEATSDRLLDVRTSGLSGPELLGKEALVSPHFLGAVVVATVLSPTGGITLRSVIDGQQRLTTTQLLVRGVLDVLTEQGSPKQHQLRDMVHNKHYLVVAAEDKFKLWPRRNDRKIWPTAMEDAAPAYSHEDHLYLQARAFFAQKARDYVTVDDVVERIRLDALADSLSTLFKLVVIDLEEVFRFARAVPDDKRSVLVLTLAYTGIRWGEAVALTVNDIDLDRCRLAIHQTATEVDGLIHVGPPKSWEARSVPFPAFLAPRLEQLIAGKKRDDLVFPARAGGYLARPDTAWNRQSWWLTALRDAGLDHMTPHDLKHTAASLAVSAGANVKALQRMLGHKSAAMTLDTYADLFEDDLASVADRLNERVLSESGGSLWSN